jgi:hypothetical protein
MVQWFDGSKIGDITRSNCWPDQALSYGAIACQGGVGTVPPGRSESVMGETWRTTRGASRGEKPLATTLANLIGANNKRTVPKHGWHIRILQPTRCDHYLCPYSSQVVHSLLLGCLIYTQLPFSRIHTPIQVLVPVGLLRARPGCKQQRTPHPSWATRNFQCDSHAG